jgi:L-threonylcarbamoyladenylate synthase
VFVKILSPQDIEQAAAFLKGGRLVAFPTETVYGLGAPIFNPAAVASIFQIKGRPADNPLIVHVDSLQWVERICVEIPDSFYRLAESFFPGPLTVVMKRHEAVPSIVSAGLPSIALRMPSHPIALKLISSVGEPIAAPSANLSGRPSATQASHVIDDFDGKIAAVIDGGKTDLGLESTVMSLLSKTAVLMRPGTIAKEQLEEALGEFIEIAEPGRGPVLSPGMKYRHYSPKASVKLFRSLGEMSAYHEQTPSKRKMVLSLRPIALSGIDVFLLSAKELYALLRSADQKHYSEILILCDEELLAQKALMNRLLRSAGS